MLSLFLVHVHCTATFNVLSIIFQGQSFTLILTSENVCKFSLKLPTIFFSYAILCFSFLFVYIKIYFVIELQYNQSYDTIIMNNYEVIKS